MYCPKCATQNESQQSYCRNCGQPLRSVQLALDGRVDEVAEKFRKAEEVLAAGLLTFGIFIVAGLISFAFAGLVPFAINIILGVVICLPIVLTGLVRVDRLRRILDPSEDPSKLHPAPPVGTLPVVPNTDPLDPALKLPGSVTEHTTRRLESSSEQSTEAFAETRGVRVKS